MKYVFLLTLLSSAIYYCYGQQGSAFFKPPIITPASPEASALYKFTETPVDYSSGLANHTIPLYNLKSGRIEVPISISYSAGGIKVQDIAGMIGLGWTLSWGGSITERGENVPGGAEGLHSIDEHIIKTEQDVQTYVNSEIAWVRLHSIANGFAQKQKPEYYFNFANYSGVFFFDVNKKVHIKSGNSNLKIEKIISPDNNRYKDGFKITTDRGIEYTFLAIETALSFSSGQNKTAYFVTKILDLTNGDNVLFTYETKPQFDDYSSESYTDFKPTPIGSSNGAQGCTWPLPSNTEYFSNKTTVSSKRISSISSKTGSITFDAATDRLDIDPTRITGFTVKAPNGSIVKKIKFSQDYFISNANLPKFGFRLKLNKVTFYNLDTTNAESFEFKYNNTLLPQYRASDGTKNYTGVDYWGYYNGHGSNNGLIPQNISISSGFISGVFRGDRSVQPTYTQACMLQRVVYPTGGYVEYTYENNKVISSMLGDFASGLRIQKAAYYSSPFSPPIVKEYRYSAGIIPVYQYANSYVYDKLKHIPCEVWDQWCMTKFISSSPIGMHSYYNQPVFYNNVEEYTKSGLRDLGKTVYSFNNPEYYGGYNGAPEYGGFVGCERKWANDNLLKSIQYYKTDSLNTYTLVRKEEYSYTDFRDSLPIIGLLVTKHSGHDYVDGSEISGSSPNVAKVHMYNFLNALNSSGVRLLTKKIIWDYNNDTLTSVTDFQYDSSRLQLKAIKVANSKDQMRTTIFKYPYDFASLSNRTTQEDVALNAMIDKNNIAEDIEQETYLGPKLLDRKRVVFKNINTYQLPEKFLQQVGNYPIETKTRFSKYSASYKLSEYNEENNIYKSVIWDKDELYPIAEVTNAAQSNIAYTSFEMGGSTVYTGTVTGNWILNINGSLNGSQSNVPMGKYCFPLSSSNTIAKNGLTNSISYIISYWSIGGVCSVTGTSNVRQGKTISGWTNYIHTVSGINSLSISTPNSNVYIDELRLYPINAQMTTYNHLPLIGVDRICDIRNKFTYYEYDDVGNLFLIRDLDNNVVKRFAYKYKELLINPNSVYANSETYKVFTKSCTTGGMGSKVVYTIPTGTFTSTISKADADLKAQNELNQNGQTYANLHGSCLYYNTRISQKVYKNNCSNGYIGTYSRYTVEDSAYSSSVSQLDANQQAQDDVNANGQSYANVNGSCVTDVPALAVTYTNQSGIYWNVTVTNVATGVSQSGTMGSYYSGTLLSSIPKGVYNINFSSQGMTVPYQTVFTVDDTTKHVSANSGGGSVAFNNIVINAVSSSPLIKTYEIFSEQPCSMNPIAGWTLGSNNIYKINSGAKVYFYLAVKAASSSPFWSSENDVVNIGSCAPSVNRTLTFTQNGRTWEVKVKSSQKISLRLISGTAPSNEEVYITGEYAL